MTLIIMQWTAAFVIVYILLKIFLSTDILKGVEESNFFLSIVKAILYIFIAAVSLSITINDKNQIIWIGYFSKELSYPNCIVGIVSSFESLSNFLSTFKFVKEKSESSAYNNWLKKYALDLWKSIWGIIYISIFLFLSGINWNSKNVLENIQTLIICINFIVAAVILGLIIKYMYEISQKQQS